MLADLLKFDSLGSRGELEFLIFSGLSVSTRHDVKILKKYCSSNNFTIGTSFDGIIKLLEFASIIRVEANLIHLEIELNHYNKDGFFEGEFFHKKVVEALIKEKALDTFFNPDGISYDLKEDTFYVKNHYIPNKFLPLRNVLIEIGLLQRDSPIDLKINNRFNQLFWNLVVQSNICSKEAGKARKISIDELKQAQAKQEEVGKEAELYVLKFEQQRLKNHPLLSSIRIISDDHVNAGYDLVSFNNFASIVHNRYIEVKSYSSETSFYWSRNEIAVSELLGDNYYLYLVDRRELQNKDYTPIIIQNPFLEIIKSNLWEKEVENWKITLK